MRTDLAAIGQDQAAYEASCAEIEREIARAVDLYVDASARSILRVVRANADEMRRKLPDAKLAAPDGICVRVTGPSVLRVDIPTAGDCYIWIDGTGYLPAFVERALQMIDREVAP